MNTYICEMNKDEMHCLGKITKLHGYKGELTVFLDTAKVADYRELQFLFLEIKVMYGQEQHMLIKVGLDQVQVIYVGHQR
jgi:ribosomal 30S subunit maturation factor RimM